MQQFVIIALLFASVLAAYSDGLTYEQEYVREVSEFANHNRLSITRLPSRFSFTTHQEGCEFPQSAAQLSGYASMLYAHLCGEAVPVQSSHACAGLKY